MYKQKYLKYKQKYFDLYYDIYGGVIKFKSIFIYNINDFSNDQQTLIDKQLINKMLLMTHSDKYSGDNYLDEQREIVSVIFKYIQSERQINKKIIIFQKCLEIIAKDKYKYILDDNNDKKDKYKSMLNEINELESNMKKIINSSSNPGSSSEAGIPRSRSEAGVPGSSSEAGVPGYGSGNPFESYSRPGSGSGIPPSGFYSRPGTGIPHSGSYSGPPSGSYSRFGTGIPHSGTSSEKPPSGSYSGPGPESGPGFGHKTSLRPPASGSRPRTASESRPRSASGSRPGSGPGSGSGSGIPPSGIPRSESRPRPASGSRPRPPSGSRPPFVLTNTNQELNKRIFLNTSSYPDKEPFHASLPPWLRKEY